MYLIFDTSASGKPKSYKAPYTDTFNWPGMIHISWLVLDEKANLIEDENHLIRNYAQGVPEEILDHHGLTQEQLANEGEDIKEVLIRFRDAVDKADYIFSFNLNFNENIVGAEFERQDIAHRLHQSERYCLMQESTYFCKLPGTDGRYKWPSLTELHQKCFGTGFAGANNARNDAIVAAKCFKYLLLKGELDDIF